MIVTDCEDMPSLFQQIRDADPDQRTGVLEAGPESGRFEMQDENPLATGHGESDRPALSSVGPQMGEKADEWGEEVGGGAN